MLEKNEILPPPTQALSHLFLHGNDGFVGAVEGFDDLVNTLHFERRLISERTRDSIEKGKRLGRPPLDNDKLDAAFKA